MIYNEEINFLQEDPYDVLIVGGGAVGLSLAASLAYDSYKICVVESGLDKFDSKFDKLKKVESNGLNIKLDSRERMLGGCGQTWAGQLAYFDKCDLIERGPNYPALGISQDEIQKLLDSFGKFFKIPKSNNFDSSKYPSSQFDFGKDFEQKVFLRQNPVFKFGDRLKHIFNRPNTDLILGWTVFDLEWDGETCIGSMITNQKKDKKFLAANKIILCSGAIENIRLLKISQNKGKLPSTLPVGERFMNHPKGISSKINLYKPVKLNDPVFKLPDKDGFTGCVGFRFNDNYVISNNLSNVYFRLLHNRNIFFNNSSRSLVNIIKHFPYNIGIEFFTWFKKLILGLFKYYDGIFGLFYESFIRLLKNFGLYKKTTKSLKVEIFAEMSSEQSNYVSLVGNKYDGDSSTPLITHSLSSNDLYSIEKILLKLNKVLDQKKIGRITFSNKNFKEIICNDASHHIGGTRITSNGKDGVVTSNLKVIGSKNLFVCGGSILRTSGNANPTMFFVGLALKLAKYIRTQNALPQESKSLFEINDQVNSQPEIVIIGAGRRVREDALPVFETLIKNQDAISVYAKNESGIFGWCKPRIVKPLNELSHIDLSKIKLIYVAVPVHEAKYVSKFLKKNIPENIKIIWDTPISNNVFYALDILKKFKIYVAEDSSYLPWLKLLENLKGKNLNQILIDRGGYKYHATAIAREIYKKINKTDHLQKKGISKSKNKLSYKINDKTKVLIKSPRSYDEGSIKLYFDDNSEIILGGNGRESNIQVIRNKKGHCSGFSFGQNIHNLSKIETELIGVANFKDDIVTMMLRIKRVGLRRLILDVFKNNSKLEITEANLDSRLF